jgi:hypothetical protein
MTVLAPAPERDSTADQVVREHAAVKAAQVVTAARCGLAVPHALLTNDAEAVRRFAWQGRG